MEKTLNLIKNDPWLEPYKDAIVGRFEHAMDKKAELTNGGNLRYRTSLPDIFISVCIALIKDGYSVSGHRMHHIFIWWVHSVIGKKSLLIN